MSLLADIYISRDHEAVRYDTTPDQFADRAQYKGCTRMITSRISPALQVAFLYGIAAVWHGIWMTAFLSSKGFLSNLHLIWGVLFFFIPVLWFYALLRVASSERAFIASHPLLFFGSIGAAMLPPIVTFIVLVIFSRT